MNRVRGVFMPVMALALGTALSAVAAAQAPERPRRGLDSSRGSLLGLLRIEQVQKELKVSDEVAAKAAELGEKVRAEMRDKFAALREMEDREQRRTKMTELRNELDRKVREQLREVLSQDQMMRLDQIRIQVLAVVDSLADRHVADRLQLTEEQQQKMAQIRTEVGAKQSRLRVGVRDATPEQRGEVFEKLRKIRSDADESALGALNTEQRDAFEKMKGEKIDLPTRRDRQ